MKNVNRKLLQKLIRETLEERSRKSKRSKRILYHINKRPARPQPKKDLLKVWDQTAVDPETGKRTGDLVPVEGTEKWERYWLKQPVKSGVFLTPNPVDIAMNHGRSGNVYAYKVPEWVINKSGGMHRYDSGSEVLVPEDVWNEAGDEIEFLGKSMDRDELWDQIDNSLFGQGHTRKATRPSWLSDEEMAAWEKRQNAFNLDGLRATRHPEDVIKMLTADEQQKAIDAIETVAGGPSASPTKDEELLALLKKHLKENALREYVRELLKENHDWTSDETLPPELRNLPQHVKDTIPIRIRKKYVKGYPKLVAGERIKIDSAWEGTVGVSPARMPAGTLLTVVQEKGEGKYSFKVDQPTIAKVGMSLEREARISPDEEFIVSGYQLWKHTAIGGKR